jgi:hypothetical protein
MFTYNNQGIERTKCAGGRRSRRARTQTELDFRIWTRAQPRLPATTRAASVRAGTETLKVDGNVVSTQKALRP